ncbi:MAG TPA: epoxide hydrolase [Stellaceae bacterium]|nr:epoxide hydrolase [Stellaceae bacterium]
MADQTASGIVPFRVAIDEAALRDLRERLARTRWPDELDAPEWSYGADLGWLRRVTEYWRDGFDWRAAEARINALAQFTAEVEGTSLHFIYERGCGPAPLPLLISHGWPGSFVEMLEIVPMLADPARFGSDPADAFEVVVPSLPGYGFSGKPLRPGMTPREMGRLFAGLMQGLGYARYGVQGGDWGATVSTWIARDMPERVTGIHLNWLPGSYLPEGGPALSADETAFRQRMEDSLGNGISTHTAIHGTRPQTLGYGLNDSPVGLAAWLLDKFRMLADCGGDLESAIPLDALLTNLSVYWFTGTITSAIRLYKEARAEPLRFAPGERIRPPLGFAAFPGEVAVPPREWASRVFDVRRWTKMARGGHFAAMEQPAALAEDIRAFFRPLRGEP